MGLYILNQMCHFTQGWGNLCIIGLMIKMAMIHTCDMEDIEFYETDKRYMYIYAGHNLANLMKHALWVICNCS